MKRIEENLPEEIQGIMYSTEDNDIEKFIRHIKYMHSLPEYNGANNERNIPTQLLNMHHSFCNTENKEEAWLRCYEKYYQ